MSSYCYLSDIERLHAHVIQDATDIREHLLLRPFVPVSAQRFQKVTSSLEEESPRNVHLSFSSTSRPLI